MRFIKKWIDNRAYKQIDYYIGSIFKDLEIRLHNHLQKELDKHLKSQEEQVHKLMSAYVADMDNQKMEYTKIYFETMIRNEFCSAKNELLKIKNNIDDLHARIVYLEPSEEEDPDQLYD